MGAPKKDTAKSHYRSKDYYTVEIETETRGDNGADLYRWKCSCGRYGAWYSNTSPGKVILGWNQHVVRAHPEAHDSEAPEGL